MKSRKKQQWSRYSNLLFRIFIAFIFLSMTFCPVPAWAVQSDVGYVMLDGEKTIAVGVWGGDEDLFPEMLEHGFNYVMQGVGWREDYTDPCNYTPIAENDQEVIDFMDAAEANGLKVMATITNSNSTSPTINTQRIQHWVTVVKDHGALWGYYFEDEPDSRYYTIGLTRVSPAALQVVYDDFRAIDPDVNRPSCIAFAFDLTDPCAQNYFPMCQLAMAECYPTAWNPTYPSEYPNIPNDVNIAADAGLEYMTLPRYFGNPDIPFPTPEEFRYMVFAPISIGAGGISQHTFDGWIDDSNWVRHDIEPGVREEVVYPATDQLAAVRDILVRADIVATSDNADADITWVFGGDSNEAVLIAVNNDPWNSKTSINFTVTGIATAFGAAEVVGEDRMIILDGSKTFTETNFDPYGVHIYHFKQFNYSVQGQNTVSLYKAAPATAYYAPAGQEYVSSGNSNGNLDRLWCGLMQLDLSAYAGKTAVGDATLTLMARLGASQVEQPGGFQVRELTKDYVYGPADYSYMEVTWQQASVGDPWNANPSDPTYWTLGGTGDCVGAGDPPTYPLNRLGDFTVTSETWTQKTMVIPQAQVNAWLGDDTVSLLIVPYAAFWGGAYHAGKVINIGADGATSPGNLTLSFEAVTSPACGDYDHPAPLGDLNGDCMVDFTDFVMLGSGWKDDTAP